MSRQFCKLYLLFSKMQSTTASRSNPVSIASAATEQLVSYTRRQLSSETLLGRKGNTNRMWKSSFLPTDALNDVRASEHCKRDLRHSLIFTRAASFTERNLRSGILASAHIWSFLAAGAINLVPFPDGYRQAHTRSTRVIGLITSSTSSCSSR